ncbi:MAG: M28 family peptidase [Bacillota bacterium]|nr:M28 family peptidase [Bacillota bacterium]
MPERSYLETDRKIIADGYTSSEAFSNLEALVGFGSRFGGTPGEKPAVDYMVRKMKEYGLQNVRAEEFQYMGWQRGPGHLTSLTPEEHEFPCIILPHVGQFEIEGEIIFVGYGTPSEFEAYRDKIHGKIVMANSESPPYFRNLHRREKISRGLSLGAKGFIFMREEGGLLPETGSTRTDAASDSPVVGVSREEGRALLHLQKKGPVTVRIKTEGKVAPAVSWHVTGEIPGTTMEDRLMLVGAHFDGHDIAVGAMDDGSGAVVTMEIGRLLAHNAGRQARTLRFICFALEEIALTGSFKYVLNHLQDIDKMDFMLNLDGAGRGEGGIALQGWPVLIPVFRKIGSEMMQPLTCDDAPSMSSDHFPFTLAGVPSGTFANLGQQSVRRGYGHTAADTLDKVSPRNLQSAAVQIARIMLRAANMPDWPAKHHTEAETIRTLDRFGIRETVRLVRYPSIPGRLDLGKL